MTKNVSHYIGRKVKELREHRNMTIDELGEKTHLNSYYLSEIEQSDSDKGSYIKAYSLFRIAKALDVEFGWFFSSAFQNRDLKEQIFCHDFKKLPYDTRQRIMQYAQKVSD